MNHDIIENIIHILKTDFPMLSDMELQPQTALVSSGLLDSFAMVTLLSSLESAFSINVDADALDVELFETPEQMSRIVLDSKFHKA